MYKVLLVDDEAIARTGLRTTFDWEGYGYRLVGEASNGQKALKWIEAGEVDILITDIAMPVMDGLELTRRTRKLCPWVKVLLLSCHSDFEYVREGIRLGAADYILKPTLDSASLKDVLERMRQKLEEEKRLERIVTEHERQQREQRKRADEKTLYLALHGEAAAMENLAGFRSDGQFVVAVCRLDGGPRSDGFGAAPLDGEEEMERFKSCLYEQLPDALAVRTGPDLLAAWVPVDGMERSEDPRCDHLLRPLAAFATIGLSRRYAGPQRLAEAYVEASASLEASFFYREGRIFHAEDIGALGDRGGPEQAKPELQALRAALAVGNLPRCEVLLQSVMERWMPSRMGKQEVLVEAEELLGMLSTYSLSALPIVSPAFELTRLRSVEEVRSVMLDAFQAVRDEPNRGPFPEATLHERIVLQAISYINAHYTEPISLQEVADEVAVSRNYFSELFKRVTGSNFIDYVIDLRVKRAKELLAATSLRVYEVAELSGFNDVKYFSKLFKKLVGMTPAEYQGLNRK